MRTMIVDDEPLARRELRRLLAPFPWIQIVGEGVDIDEARERIEAFEVSALDYLLKPVEPERLAAALAKVESWMLSQAAGPGAALAPLQQLFVRDGPRCWFVPLREVSVVSSEGNYVRLQWGKQRPLLGRSLSALAEKLDPQLFFRANRHQILNLEFIQSVEAGAGGRLYVQLRDGPEVEISRRQGRLFRARTSV